MRIATTTGDFTKYAENDSQRIRELYDAGFRYIDLDMYSFTPDSPYMQDSWREEAEKIKALAEELGMKFVQAHSQGGNPLSDDTAHVDFLVAATIRSIEICQVLGIENTVVHFGFAKGISKEQAFERNRDFFRRLFPAMERCGVNVLVENSTKVNLGDMYYPNTAKDILEFLEYADHPRLHVCWDTGHGNCEGHQYDEIVALGDQLYAIHYNDNHGFKDEHLIPFMGTLNHDEIINALMAIDYKGYMTLECSSSLIRKNYWLGGRRSFKTDTRLAEPQLFMQRRLEILLYETAKYILESYGIFEA